MASQVGQASAIPRGRPSRVVLCPGGTPEDHSRAARVRHRASSWNAQHGLTAQQLRSGDLLDLGPDVPAIQPAAEQAPQAALAAPSKLAGVLHDQRSRLGPIPLEEAFGLATLVEDDKQSVAGGTEPPEPRVRRPGLRLIAVLYQGLEQDARRKEVRDARRNQRPDEVPLVQAHVVVLDAQGCREGARVPGGKRHAAATAPPVVEPAYVGAQV